MKNMRKGNKSGLIMKLNQLKAKCQLFDKVGLVGELC
jgi:hypothetical protein